MNWMKYLTIIMVNALMVSCFVISEDEVSGDSTKGSITGATQTGNRASLGSGVVSIEPSLLQKVVVKLYVVEKEIELTAEIKLSVEGDKGYYDFEDLNPATYYIGFFDDSLLVGEVGDIEVKAGVKSTVKLLTLDSRGIVTQYEYLNITVGVKENTIEKCSDGIDNDLDGNIDCDDIDCGVFQLCSPSSSSGLPGKAKENTSELCSDGLDNDGDGFVDCDDQDCEEFEVCKNQNSSSSSEIIAENSPENCLDDIDNDNDGDMDCSDEGCAMLVYCQDEFIETENTPRTCFDNIDNDEDGLVDCEEYECGVLDGCYLPLQGDAVKENTVERCSNGIDDDSDGKVDCEDEVCQFFTICLEYISSFSQDTNELSSSSYSSEEEEMSSTIYDPDPRPEREDSLEECFDGIDNDGDGYVDCDDDRYKDGCTDLCATVYSSLNNFWESSASEDNEIECSDGIDDDGDGNVDCDDDGCKGLCESHIENNLVVCYDGLDNDLDGLIDCYDSECAVICGMGFIDSNSINVIVEMDTVVFDSSDNIEPVLLTELFEELRFVGNNSFAEEDLPIIDGEVYINVTNDWGGIHVKKGGDSLENSHGDVLDLRKYFLRTLEFDLKMESAGQVDGYLKFVWCENALGDVCEDDTVDGTGVSTVFTFGVSEINNTGAVKILNLYEDTTELNSYDGEWHSYSLDLYDIYGDPEIAKKVTVPFAVFKDRYDTGDMGFSVRNLRFGGLSDHFCFTNTIKDRDGNIIKKDDKIHCK